MSLVAIRAALETALNGMSPALSTAFENAAFTPVTGTPYQAAYVLFAEPDNAEMGDANHQERGIFQVTLRYPLGTGPAAAAARAQLLRTTFRRTATFTSGSTKVHILRTPEVAPGSVDGDRWAVPVRIRFYANIAH